MTTSSAPLANIKVLDLSRLLPGPYATRLLADLGAEVIKVETPTLGDYARKAPPEFGGLAMFDMLNCGKKSIAINYRNKEGGQVFLKLAETADVIIETFKPGSVDKWGIGYKAMRAINPRVIYCSLSGYGQTGPYAARPGHDLNYMAIGGLLGLNGHEDQSPVPPGFQIADLGGATFAALNILAAILNRQQTGEGQYLDVAMLDPVLHWMLPIAGSLFFGTGQPPRQGNLPLAGGWPCYNVYKTADNRYVALGALEPPFWTEFCRIVERDDLISGGYNHENIATVAEIIGQKYASEWLQLFDGLNCPFELILTVPETLEHPQVRHRGLADGAALKSPFPYALQAGNPPALGQDTRAIMQSAGYSMEEIEKLAQSKVIKLAG